MANIANARENNLVFGHEKSISAIQNIINSKKIPHAFLISGYNGIGKATLCYQIAKYLLSDSNLDNLQFNPSHPAINRINKNTHPDLLTIEPEEQEKNITVEAVRKINSFFSLTSSAAKYKIAIIDTADQMNVNAANAILKILEEPPKNSLFLLVSNSPEKLLSTIRSRCRHIKLGCLSPDSAYKIAKALLPQSNDEELLRLLTISRNSPGTAVSLHERKAINLYHDLIAILELTPSLDTAAIFKLAEKVAKDEQNWLMATNLLVFLLHYIIITTLMPQKTEEAYTLPLIQDTTNIKYKIIQSFSVNRLISLYKRINNIVYETNKLKLDKKLALLTIFHEFKQHKTI